MDATGDSPSSRRSYASIVEHLMFAIVPGGLAVLMSPLLAKQCRLSMNLQQDFTLTRKAFLSTAAAMTALQITATVMWWQVSFGSDASFPAAALSLLASVVVCAAVQSDLSKTLRHTEFPFYLLAVTIFYDVSVGWHCFTSGFLDFAKLQWAIATCKFVLIILGDTSSHVSGRLLAPFQRLKSRISLLSDSLEGFFVVDASYFNGQEESEHLFHQFMRYWKPRKGANGRKTPQNRGRANDVWQALRSSRMFRSQQHVCADYSGAMSFWWLSSSFPSQLTYLSHYLSNIS